MFEGLFHVAICTFAIHSDAALCALLLQYVWSMQAPHPSVVKFLMGEKSLFVVELQLVFIL